MPVISAAGIFRYSSLVVVGRHALELLVPAVHFIRLEAGSAHDGNPFLFGHVSSPIDGSWMLQEAQNGSLVIFEALDFQPDLGDTPF